MSVTLNEVKYPPELIPQAGLADISASSRTTIADIKGFNKHAQLGDMSVTLNYVSLYEDNDVQLEITRDGTALDAVKAGVLRGLSYEEELNVFASKSLVLKLYNSNATTAKSNYQYRFAYWIDQLTIADKLFRGLSLTAEETEINTQLNVTDAVGASILPYPRDYFIQRAYQVVEERIYTFRDNVTAASGAEMTPIRSYANQFMVLKKISLATPTPTTMELKIGRDYVDDYVTLNPYSTGDITTDINCFIPAKDELRLSFTTGSDVSNFEARFHVLFCRLTDYLKMKWGLMRREENEDLYFKVKAGVLAI